MGTLPDDTFFFFVAALVFAIAISPVLIIILKKFGIVRTEDRDFSSLIETRKKKGGTPVMGGIVIVLVITIITLLFNWKRETTFVPIGVLLLSALLGGIDDLLNVFYKKSRPVKTLGKVMRLIRVHKNVGMRVWYILISPWYAYKRFFFLLGSHPGQGIQAHEKIFVQFVIGAIVAWWLSFKLNWTELWVPGMENIDLGFFIIPIIIFFVMFMANAVNITDGIDGLSAGSLLIAFGTYFVIAIQHGNESMIFLLATIVGALAGYLLFNISPAKYQMGDVASLGMGVLLTAVAFALDRVILLPLIGGVFFLEIGSVLVQTSGRVLVGRRLLRMAPLHHHLEMRKWSEARIVMYAWTFGALLSLFALWLSYK